MAFQTWETLINAYQPSSTTTGTEFKEFTAAKDITPGTNLVGQALTIPASFLVPGNILAYRASGIFSSVSKAKLKLGLYWGGVAGKVLAETLEVETPEPNTNNSWILEATSRVISVGTAGEVLTQGTVTGIEAKSLAGASASTTMMPEETSTGGKLAEFDTSVAKIVTVGATWGTSSASNKIQCFQWLVEILN